MAPPLKDGTLMFCGTLAALGGIRPSAEFRYRLGDPARGREIAGRYAVGRSLSSPTRGRAQVGPVSVAASRPGLAHSRP